MLTHFQTNFVLIDHEAEAYLIKLYRFVFFREIRFNLKTFKLICLH